MRVNRDRIESQGVELLAGLAFGQNRERACHASPVMRMIQSITIFDQTRRTDPERHAENNPETRGSLELGVSAALCAARHRQRALHGHAVLPECGHRQRNAAGRARCETDVALERNFRLSDRGVFPLAARAGFTRQRQ